MEANGAVVQRLPNLEVLRGVAALVVLLGHAYGLSGTGVPLSAGNAIDVLMMVTPTGVWLFFCLSGLVISQPFVRALVRGTDRPDAPAYATRRAARIFPLYLVCAFATVAVIGATGESGKSLGAHLLLLHNLLPGHQQEFIGVTWTLSLEILFYGAIPVLAFGLARAWRRPLTAATLARLIVWSGAASVAWMFAGGALGSSPDLSLYVRMLFPSMWSAFCPGLLIAVLEVATPEDFRSSATLRLLQHVRTDVRFASVVGIAAAAVGVASTLAQTEWGAAPYLWVTDLGRLAWTVAFGVLILRAIDAHHLVARTPRALVSLGTWSYGVYLIHGTVLTILLRFDDGSLIPMPHGGFVAFVVHLAFVLGFTVPLSWLSWRLLEQPAIRLSKQVPRRRTAVAQA